jgi:choline-glycine betaine transporter
MGIDIEKIIQLFLILVVLVIIAGAFLPVIFQIILSSMHSAYVYGFGSTVPVAVLISLVFVLLLIAPRLKK